MTLEDLAFDSIARTDPVAILRKTSFPVGKQEVPATGQGIAVNVNILALDLGTHTGWAIRRRDGAIVCGTEDFTPRKSWGPGQRAIRFQSWLSERLETHQIHQITYEAVHRHLGTDAAHMYGLFEGLVWMAADRRNIRVVPIGVGTIKKHWTGSGRADKAAMIAEAKRRGFKPVDDNAADALAILHWAIAKEGD